MFINVVNDFIAFLGNRRHTHDEVLAHLTLRSFAGLGCTGAALLEVRPNSRIELVAKYGQSSEFFDGSDRNFRLTDSTPVAEAIVQDRAVWVTTLPKWGKAYPDFDKVEPKATDKTFICWPITQSGTPCAVIGIFCRDVISASDELQAFFKAISNLLALYFYEPHDEFNSFKDLSRRRAIHNGHNGDGNLTERQLLILRLIAEGRTNMSISDTLGYSESTIRQETIKIYAKLQCLGRHEASKIYRETFASEHAS